MTNKKCPKSGCNGELIWIQIYGVPAKEFEENKCYKCNKCGYYPSVKEYKNM